MKKYLRTLALGLIFGASAIAGLALAQTFTGSLQQSQDLRSFFQVDSLGNLYIQGNRHLLTQNGGNNPPVLTSCATGGSPGIAGTDFAGVITAGTTASTTCTVTFGTAFLTAPNCTVTWQSGPLAAMSWATSTTALTITQTSNASSKIAYVCTSAS